MADGEVIDPVAWEKLMAKLPDERPIDGNGS